jgi:hypothetical protein
MALNFVIAVFAPGSRLTIRPLRSKQIQSSLNGKNDINTLNSIHYLPRHHNDLILTSFKFGQNSFKDTPGCHRPNSHLRLSTSVNPKAWPIYINPFRGILRLSVVQWAWAEKLSVEA